MFFNNFKLSTFLPFPHLNGHSKENRENYPRKCSWTKEKENFKFNPGLALLGLQTTGPDSANWQHNTESISRASSDWPIYTEVTLKVDTNPYQCAISVCIQQGQWQLSIRVESRALGVKPPELLYYFFVWNTKRVLYVIMYILKKYKKLQGETGRTS